MNGAIAASPRLRLADALIAQSRADEAELVLRPLAAVKDAAAMAALAPLYLAQGRLTDAAACARTAIAAGPLPARVLVALADTLARAHDAEAADAALARAIDAGDTALELRVARARLAEERGRTDLALRHWQRVLGLAADHLDGRFGIVRALRGEARFSDAERLCRELLATAPKDPRPAAEFARIAYDAGDPLGAETRWHDALLASPGQFAALIGLAQALTAQHRFAEARELLAELAARDPSRSDPVASLVRTLLVEGDLEAAAHHARALIALDAVGSDHRLLLGRVLEAAGDGASATAHYLEIVAAFPQALGPRIAIGELAARQGDFPTARSHFEQALALAPEHVGAHLGLAGTLAELGLADEAIAAADAAVAHGPNQANAHLGRAAVAEAMGRLDAARLAVIEARSALPWRVEPLLQLVQLSLRHGRTDAAAAHGETLLAAHPRHLGARLAAFDTATAAGRHEGAWTILSALAEELPAHREIQRRLARCDWRDGAVERARARWARITRHDVRIHGGPDLIRRLDQHPMPAPEGEIRAFLLVRNELVRLPWLLDYYRTLGVHRFLVIDNGSDDGTREWLLAQPPDVHLFHTECSFAGSGAGMRWTNRLLDAHGCGAWCLTIDADEVLVYPRCERSPLPILAAYLDGAGAEAMAAPMLDLYSESPLDEVRYEPGQSLIDAFPWFDGSGYVRRDSNDFPYFRLHGGCRARVFYEHAAAGPVLQKVPLIRWRPEIKYTSSKHTAFPCRLADVSGALLHFKYLPEFAAQVRAEVSRGQHFLGAKEYRAYQRRLEHGEDLSLIAAASQRYRDSMQLVELGLMQTSTPFESYVRERPGA